MDDRIKDLTSTLMGLVKWIDAHSECFKGVNRTKLDFILDDARELVWDSMKMMEETGSG